MALGVGRIEWMNHRASDTGIRGVLTIPCSRGHGVQIEMPTKFPHDVVKKKLMQQGWVFHGSKPVCPDCVEADKHKGPRAKPKLTVVPAAPPPQQDLEPIVPQPTVPEKEPPMDTSATAIASATLTPSARAKAARREVMQWLEESFELTGPEKGRYKAGVTDATIAKETGCSEDAVKKIREEFFGLLDKPKELDGISAEIGTLRLAAAELERKATEAADEIKRNATAEAEVIRRKATELTERLNKISREQGWS
ncbi:MAG: hypothetical protein ACJ75S_06800 [Solirubrobacterales bacterium]